MLEKRLEKMEKLARESGLDFFPVIFETVTPETMYNNIAYGGLPIRARHWSYGRSYDHTKSEGQMGLSKSYEIIINSNPSYAFMLDNQTTTQKLFITAHCYGHSDFFKNNIMFKGTDRKMIWHAAEHADRVDKYIEEYGIDAVERIMDIAFALERHIDINKGQYRKPYPKKKIKSVKRKTREFDDLIKPEFLKKPSIKKVIANSKLPPTPEKDLLWFFINYAPLDDWEKDILDIVREEAFYFYPQGLTKIMNEGWASFWHAELMYLHDEITPEEQLEFAATHEKVVQPGGNPYRINPYYLGYKIYKDIEKRWDEKYKNGDSKITGREKIFQVRAEEDDISFLRNYLTEDLIKELKLFTFGITDKNDSRNNSDADFYEIKARVKEDVVEALVSPMYHNYAPVIEIIEANSEEIVLKHTSRDTGTLDFNYAKHVMEYIWELWTATVKLHVVDDDGEEVVLLFDELGSSKTYPNKQMFIDEVSNKGFII